MGQLELMDMARQGPIRIRMVDGRSYDVPGVEHIIVSRRSAAILHPNSDGEMSIMHLPLSTMTAVEPIFN